MNLETEIATTLTSETATAAELQSLVARAQGAIVDAEAEAKREEERVFDPQLAPDPKEAKAAMESALLASGRMRTLLTRLTRKRASVEAEERKRAWEADFKTFKEERNALADELLVLYPEVEAKLIDLFTRITVFETAKLHQLHLARPSGVSAHLAGVELEVRGLEQFTRDTPPILNQILLFDLASGKRSWPPIVKRDLSFAIPVIDEPGRSADWWKPEIREARAAEAAREQKRLAEFYENQKQEREARERVSAK